MARYSVSFVFTFICLAVGAHFSPVVSGARQNNAARLGGAALPLPTADQLTWSELELGALIHFNMATYLVDNPGWPLHGDRSPHRQTEGSPYSKDEDAVGSLPSPSLFNPTKLNISQWADSMRAFGAKYAVLVVKHNTGFALWPSQVKFPQFNFTYNYTIAASPSPSKNIAMDFVDAMKKYDILPGFYCSLANNEYLNVRSNHVQPGPVSPGQVKLTQEQYDEVALALLSELWTEFGPLEEAWFDGGYSSDIQQRLAKQIGQQQPHATAFNGFGISENPIRWIGTESGHAPADTWSTTKGGASGGGDPNGNTWYPPECDTTLQNRDAWFYNKNVGVRPLSELIQVYHDTVGHNCNLMLDFAPTPEGLIAPDQAAQYKAFGDFIRNCYSKPVGSTSGHGNVIELTFASPATFDRLMIREDQSKGQCIRGYNTSALTTSQSALTSGHSVGNKRIDLLSSPVENVKSVRLQITDMASGCTPAVSMFAVFDCHTMMNEIIKEEQAKRLKN